MKKLLIIQTDGIYFLHETLRVLETSKNALKDYELTVYVSPVALAQIKERSIPLVPGLTTDETLIRSQTYEVSANLSMDEASWDLHNEIKSARKIGPYRRGTQVSVPDLWSTFLLTVKAGAPFLTFHLQDIYRNILGIRKLVKKTSRSSYKFKEIILGDFNPQFLQYSERKELIYEIKKKFPALPLRELSSVDLISDLSNTLYLGPATLDALRLCEAGSFGVFLGRSFQGLNLMPYNGEHFLLTTKGSALESKTLIPFLESIIRHRRPLLSPDFSIYQLDDENLFGVHLKSLNSSDDSYPFYQVHVVLWNFLLSLFDVNLDVSKCSDAQIEMLSNDKEVLTKLLRLQDYALSSIDTIYNQVKAASADGGVISGHLKNLQEIEEVVTKLAESRPMLRPFLDFYRLRRGQNDGNTLIEQVQHSYLTYSEEHHALTALDELFSVTLRKNEVSI